MSQRRMFSPNIVESDAFLDMPSSSQALYFHLGMFADDDGFVNPRRIMRMMNASEDDLKVLVTKRFVLPFENGVIVIKHWRINNLVRKDWYKETQYLEQKKTLMLKENGSYTEANKELVNEPLTQVILGKVILGNTLQPPALPESDEDTSYESDDDVTPTGEVKRRKARADGYKGELTNPLFLWAEERIGHKLIPPLKQKKAIATMLSSNFTPEQIKACWEELENDEYWSNKGIDFMTVFGQIGKHKTEKKLTVKKYY